MLLLRPEMCTACIGMALPPLAEVSQRPVILCRAGTKHISQAQLHNSNGRSCPGTV